MDSENYDDKDPLFLPLQSWDIYAMHLAKLKEERKKEGDLKILTGLKQKHNWKSNLKKILRGSYESLVLTDRKIVIEWASEGFLKMTGYPVEYALGKSPRFLQGKNTTPQSRKTVRENLKTRKVFSVDLINYRKNGEEYICRVQIHPLENEQEELIHFLALEKEVKKI